jgi:hypothetical protein
MSDIVEEHVEKIVTHIVSNVNETVSDVKEVVDKSIAFAQENIVDITKINFNQVFENFLNQNEEQLKKVNITIAPEMKKYFLLLCKDKPEFFNDIESSLKKIIMDDKIDTKDIPEIMILVSKVYGIIKGDKNVPKIDPYELIKTLLQQLFIIYAETNKIQNSELVVALVNIIDASINLVKLKSIKVPKVSCLSSIFKM